MLMSLTLSSFALVQIVTYFLQVNKVSVKIDASLANFLFLIQEEVEGFVFLQGFDTLLFVQK